MPEIAEVKLSSEFISKHGSKTFVKIEKSPFSKIKTDLTLLSYDRFKVISTTRGKEMILIFICMNTGNSLEMKVTLGMSGAWIFYDPVDQKTEKYHKHTHLRIFTENGFILGLYDVRRFAKWSWGTFDSRRSPCPLEESLEFRSNLSKSWKTHRDFKKNQLCEILMNQAWFNGVGNYLRAEILYRLDKDPFQIAAELDDKDVEELANLVIDCAKVAYKLGGGQLKDWKNPEGADPTSFKEWIKCYGIMEKIVDGTGRAFWFDQKWKR